MDAKLLSNPKVLSPVVFVPCGRVSQSGHVADAYRALKHTLASHPARSAPLQAARTSTTEVDGSQAAVESSAGSSEVQAVLFDCNCKSLPYSVDLVRACRAAGLRIAVISAAARSEVDTTLRAAGYAENDFDVVVSADSFEPRQPESDTFRVTAQALGTPQDRCVVIADTSAGMQAARTAGMRCIGVGTSLTAEKLEPNSADAIHSHLANIALTDILATPRSLQSDRIASNATASTSARSKEAVGWLDHQLPLPGGYKTTRRDLLKLLPVAGLAGTGYALVQNAKAFSYVSPRAILRTLLQGEGAPRGTPSDLDDRIAAFRRYIADKERRQALEAVPEFPPGLTWFNSPPLKLGRELRGKVVIYDFWTFCCANCMHILPSLAALEAKYAGQPVAVVGVHSAKFDNEKDDDSIRNAVLRYEIRHPCVNDGRMVLWRDLGISSWPTLAVVSPRGRLIATLPGEGTEQVVDAFIQAALAFYGERGKLDNTPLPLALEVDKDARLASLPLRYPGKLAADVSGHRLFIADSNNNRIVITDLDGTFLDQIGGSGPRLADGSFQEAAFFRPQGLAFSSAANALYVADTENHALRKVDLAARQVTTLAGNGSKGSDYVGGRTGRNQQLNSPWDLALEPQEDVLYIAMAGQHQIWRHYVATGVTKNFSGDGAERNANGGSGRTTSWAQPSGLSLSADGLQLWVADSESSSIRSLALADGAAKGHVGGDPVFSDNLFKFGDVDGQGSDARLQHPLAVCSLPDGSVLVADSYNHRLKVLDPVTDRINSVAGSGSAGFADGRGTVSRLSEPGGLAAGPNGTVLVADTNNSLIRVFDAASRSLTTLQLRGVPPPRVSPDAAQSASFDQALPPGASLVAVDPVQASRGELQIVITLPQGYHLTKGAVSRFETLATAGAIQLQPPAGQLSAAMLPSATVRFRRTAAGAAQARIGMKIYFCQDEAVCLFEEVVFDVPFAESWQQGDAVVALRHEVSAKAPPTALF